MERFEKRTEILTDLIHINKDCSTTCQTIISDINDKPVAKGAVQKLLCLCRDCIAELHMRVDPTYSDPADAVDWKGGIYRSWQSTANSIFSRQAPEIFAGCEQKTQALKNAYELALHRSAELPEDITNLLNAQLARITATCDYIRSCKKETRVVTTIFY